MDYSPLGSSVHWIFQARTLEEQTTKFRQQLKPNHLLPKWQLPLDYVRCPFPSLGVWSVEMGWTIGTATVEVGDSEYIFML